MGLPGQRSLLTAKSSKEKKAAPKFRLRSKPAQPKRGKYARAITIDSGDTVEKVLANLENEGVNPAEARFQVRQMDNYDCNCCYGSYSDACELIYDVPEDEELFEKRLATYRERLASWEKWRDEHQEEIAARLAEEAAEKEAKLARMAEKSRKSLEKEKKNLEKRLGNLKKRLRK